MRSVRESATKAIAVVSFAGWARTIPLKLFPKECSIPPRSILEAGLPRGSGMQTQVQPRPVLQTGLPFAAQGQQVQPGPGKGRNEQRSPSGTPQGQPAGRHAATVCARRLAYHPGLAQLLSLD